jgi:hypothetical protein
MEEAAAHKRRRPGLGAECEGFEVPSRVLWVGVVLVLAVLPFEDAAGVVGVLTVVAGFGVALAVVDLAAGFLAAGFLADGFDGLVPRSSATTFSPRTASSS